MTNPASVDDRLALADLSNRYAVAVDRRDFDVLREIFVPDCSLDTGRSQRSGIDAVLEAMRGLLRYQTTSHVVGQHVVEVFDADKASTVTYCTAHHLSVADDAGVQTDKVMHIHYYDECVRTDRGWRIAQRRLDIRWSDERAID
jgi:hypothetical protein